MTALAALSPVLLLDPADNVLVARRDVAAGEVLAEHGLTAAAAAPMGHKLALRFIGKGEAVRKYGVTIGFAAHDCPPGTYLHDHNVLMGDPPRDWRFGAEYRPATLRPAAERATFQGIRRADGRVATRNYIGIFITVNCAATVARRIAAHFTEARMAAFPNVDGVIPFIHQQGCGMEGTGEAMDLLHRTLKGYIAHPNLAGAVVCGLGCERNSLERFFADSALEAGKTLRAIRMQTVGGTAAAIAEGIRAVEEMLEEANMARREAAAAAHLTLGLQCGGSDGFSGLSANPALGAAVDLLVADGGAAILSETPELYGIEHLLTARAKDEGVGRAFLSRIRWWLDYTDGRDVQMQGRVGPGNRDGGLANVIEKALGGMKKGGTAGIEAVYRYAETVTARGLSIMDTPGYDPVAATGQIAGGANLICFTTGRGSCFGSFPAPTLKLASNTPMYRRMEGDMDVNCGPVVDGDMSVEEMGAAVYAAILAAASGRPTKSEALGVGAEEFAPWPIGVTG